MLPLVKPGPFNCPGCKQEVKDLLNNLKRCPEMIEHLDSKGDVINRSKCNYYYEKEVKEHIFPSKIGNIAANVGVKAGGGLLFIIVLCTVLIPALVYGIKGSEGAQSCGGGLIVMVIGFGFLMAIIAGPLFAVKKAGGGFLNGLRNLFK
jgi:hypothetical protein